MTSFEPVVPLTPEMITALTNNDDEQRVRSHERWRHDERNKLRAEEQVSRFTEVVPGLVELQWRSLT